MCDFVRREYYYYLHMFVYIHRVAQVTGIYIHKTVEYIQIWVDVFST